MLLVSKDKSQYNTTVIPSADPNYYVIDNPNLEDKVVRGFPNIDFVFDEHEEIVDVIYTIQPPMTESERIEKNAADIAYVAMMTDVEIEE